MRKVAGKHRFIKALVMIPTNYILFGRKLIKRKTWQLSDLNQVTCPLPPSVFPYIRQIRLD